MVFVLFCFFFSIFKVLQDLNTETRFITEIPKGDQWKERNLFHKTVLGFWDTALNLRDQHIFAWTAGIQTVLFTFSFDFNFLKNENLI